MRRPFRPMARAAAWAGAGSRGPHLSARLTAATATPERAWLGEVSAVVLQQAPADLNTAYRKSFASVTGRGRQPAGPGGPDWDRRKGHPVHRQCPVQGADQREAAPAQDRGRTGALVAPAAAQAVMAVVTGNGGAAVLAPRVSGRSRDRRHRHDRTGTHAGWRSAQREIAPAQLAGRRPPAVPMFCVPAAGMNPRPCRRHRRQYDAGATVGNTTPVQENDSAGQTAPELAVPCRSAAANSPSTGSA